MWYAIGCPTCALKSRRSSRPNRPLQPTSGADAIRPVVKVAERRSRLSGMTLARRDCKAPDMDIREPLWMSVASGCVWALIGLTVAFLGNLPSITLRQAALSVAGGVIAAPVIGLLMGAVSKTFQRMPVEIRILIAGGSLYLGALLFVIASRLFSSLLYGRMARDFWINSVGVAWAGLVLTWFFVVLWPLAYANHALISRAWTRQASAAARKAG